MDMGKDAYRAAPVYKSLLQYAIKCVNKCDEKKYK
jgi:hypothetical protein